MAFVKKKLTKEDLNKYTNSDVPNGKYLYEGMPYVYDGELDAAFFSRDVSHTSEGWVGNQLHWKGEIIKFGIMFDDKYEQQSDKTYHY